jgi:probable rRNA maturation factor
MPIRFFSESIDFQLPFPRKTSNWIKAVAKKEKATIKEINYIFCSDQYLLSLNQGYLKHNTLTDIITFDYSDSRQLEGEIYISVERVLDNSKKLKVEFTHELSRVIIHGVLHLCGYKDKNPSEKVVMRKKEDRYLSLR